MARGEGVAAGRGGVAGALNEMMIHAAAAPPHRAAGAARAAPSPRVAASRPRGTTRTRARVTRGGSLWGVHGQRSAYGASQGARRMERGVVAMRWDCDVPDRSRYPSPLLRVQPEPSI